MKVLFSYLGNTRMQGTHADSRISNKHTPQKYFLLFLNHSNFAVLWGFPEGHLGEITRRSV